jgi:hypothetical protein
LFPRRLRIAIGPEIPRAAIASLLPVVPVSFVTLRELPIRPRTAILKSVALAILPGSKSPAIGAALALAFIRGSVDEWLWRVRRSARLRLKSWLRLLVNSLALRGGRESIRQAANIAVIIQIVVALSGRSLLAALCERLCGLRRRNKPEVMLSVLQIILCRDRISASMRVSCELEIFFCDMMRVAAYFDIRPIRFIGPR